MRTALQVSARPSADEDKKKYRLTRTVTISVDPQRNKYDIDDVVRDIGDTYTVYLWHELGTERDLVETARRLSDFTDVGKAWHDNDLNATVVQVPVRDAHTPSGVRIQVSYPLAP